MRASLTTNPSLKSKHPAIHSRGIRAGVIAHTPSPQPATYNHSQLPRCVSLNQPQPVSRAPILQPTRVPAHHRQAVPHIAQSFVVDKILPAPGCLRPTHLSHPTPFTTSWTLVMMMINFHPRRTSRTARRQVMTALLAATGFPATHHRPLPCQSSHASRL